MVIHVAFRVFRASVRFVGCRISDGNPIGR